MIGRQDTVFTKSYKCRGKSYKIEIFRYSNGRRSLAPFLKNLENSIRGIWDPESGCLVENHKPLSERLPALTSQSEISSGWQKFHFNKKPHKILFEKNLSTVQIAFNEYFTTITRLIFFLLLFLFLFLAKRIRNWIRFFFVHSKKKKQQQDAVIVFIINNINLFIYNIKLLQIEFNFFCSKQWDYLLVGWWKP